MKLVSISLLLLASVSSWSMQIFVRGLDGKTFTIQTSPDDSVLELKQKIEEKKAIPVNRQRLHYAGRDLADERILSDYKIEATSTLNLCFRVFANDSTED